MQKVKTKLARRLSRLTSAPPGKTPEAAKKEAVALFSTTVPFTDTDEPRIKEEGKSAAVISLPIEGVEAATAAQRGNIWLTNEGSAIEMGVLSSSGACIPILCTQNGSTHADVNHFLRSITTSNQAKTCAMRNTGACTKNLIQMHTHT